MTTRLALLGDRDRIVTSEGTPTLPFQNDWQTLAEAVEEAANTVDSFSTRADLSGAPVGSQAYLTEAGREGVFVFNSADLSAKVTADPQQGIYVAPASAATGVSGAWVRKFDGAVNAKWFGAVGDGATNDRAAMQAAVDERGVLGGEIHLTRSTYRIGAAANKGIAITAPTSVVGEGGSFTAINPAASTATDDTLVITPNPAYNMENALYSSFALHDPSTGTRADRYGIFLDTQVAGAYLPKLLIERVIVGQGSSYGIYHLNNAVNNVNGGLYAATFRDCTIKGGIKLEQSGDSLNILECLIAGTGGIGVNASLVAGASVLTVERCNITNAQGAFRLDNGPRFRFVGNNCENSASGATANNSGAIVNITGSGGVVYGGLIEGNLLSGFGSTDATILVKLQNCQGTLIDNNVFLSGGGGLTTGIEIGNTCQDVRIGRNVFNAAITTKVTDNGQGTMGVIKTATLANSWVAYNVGTESLQFIKDPSSGEVTLYGSIKDGTSTNGTTITTLPAGFRPPKIVRAPLFSVNSGTPVPGQINIESNGVVSITYVSGSQELHINTTFAADNIGNAVSAE